MKEYHQFDEWTDRVLLDNDEFYYRYIYDAYLLAASNRKESHGMYFVLTVQPAGSSTGYILEDTYKDYCLVLPSDAARQELAVYLSQRFCGGKNMEEWHNKSHNNYRDDWDNWVDVEGNPVRSK